MHPSASVDRKKISDEERGVTGENGSAHGEIVHIGRPIQNKKTWR